MILYLSGKSSLKPGETRWKCAPGFLSGHQTLVFSTATRHLFLLEWQEDAVFLPTETTLTGNEMYLLHVLWDACPGICDRIDLMNTLAMPRELVWRTISTLRKKLKHFGIDIAVCEYGYVLVRYGERGEDSGK
jgi:hypothetical protein